MNKQIQPLAARMRPFSLDDFFGQAELLGEGKLLRRLIEADKLSSVIFFGPPGTGKTTLAEIIARTTGKQFFRLNAVNAGTKEIRDVAEKAANRILTPQGKVILFLDEVHRLNRTQQDVLLPFVEQGLIILIGATTENPYFSISVALQSRSTMFRFAALSKSDIVAVINSVCIKTLHEGILPQFEIMPAAVELLAELSEGDARAALNALELALLTTPPIETQQEVLVITPTIIEDCLQRKAVRYDRSGDNHYDVISAFIKSMRGGDPDATIHYLARMLTAGEDVEFIARRIVIAASEDVGLGNPAALQVAVAAAQAVKMLGMPEARIVLAEAAVLLAISPHSNSTYQAINLAMEEIGKIDVGEVPAHLRDSSYASSKKLGHGVDYKYPHDYPDTLVQQQYLPDPIVGKCYYIPTDRGFEGKLKARINDIRSKYFKKS